MAPPSTAETSIIQIPWVFLKYSKHQRWNRDMRGVAEWWRIQP